MDRRKIGFAGVAGRTWGRTQGHTHVTNKIFRYPTKIDALTQLDQLIKPG